MGDEGKTISSYKDGHTYLYSCTTLLIPHPFKKESKPSKDTDLWQSSTRAADDLAREALASLQRGQRPSGLVVLKALRLWGFDKNKSRQNVIPDGRTPS